MPDTPVSHSPFPSLPIIDDPIDELFVLDPLAEGFTEEVLRSNTEKLVKLFRAEIAEYNAAVERAAVEGKKRSGVTTKAAQKKAVALVDGEKPARKPRKVKQAEAKAADQRQAELALVEIPANLEALF